MVVWTEFGSTNIAFHDPLELGLDHDVGSCGDVLAGCRARTGPVYRVSLGTVLGDRNEVESIIGRGRTAEVYRAWDRVMLHPVTIKLFSTPALRGHGNETLQSVGLVDGRPFAVMDLVNGAELGQRAAIGAAGRTRGHRAGHTGCLRPGPRTRARCSARDATPGNVLLDMVRGPRLADLGPARIVDAARITATGAVVGTPAYVAPEQVRGGRVGAPADIYSLGLVLLEAVTGRREYGGGLVGSAVARLHRIPWFRRRYRPRWPR